jgi:hypothetical protein
VVEKLELNEFPWIMSSDRYVTKQQHEHDKERVLGLALKAVAARAEIEEFLDATIAELQARKVELEAQEAVEAAEATFRARFDDSERGRILHRNERDLERSFARTLRELRDLSRWKLQMMEWEEVAATQTRLHSTPPAAQNEATGRRPGDALKDWVPVEKKGYSEINVRITPPIDPKRKQ